MIRETPTAEYTVECDDGSGFTGDVFDLQHEPPAPKFKVGDRVKPSGRAPSNYTGCGGVVAAVHENIGHIGVQVRPGFSVAAPASYFDLDESPKFKVGDKVRISYPHGVVGGAWDGQVGEVTDEEFIGTTQYYVIKRYDLRRFFPEAYLSPAVTAAPTATVDVKAEGLDKLARAARVLGEALVEIADILEEDAS
jgi:hypothetical protein